MFYPLIQSTWFRWSTFLLCATVVAYVYFRPSPPEQVFSESDKVGHVVTFCALALSARFAMPRVRWFWFWSGLFAVAPLLEYLQAALRPLRLYSAEDIYANLAGVIIALIISTLFRPRNIA